MVVRYACHLCQGRCVMGWLVHGQWCMPPTQVVAQWPPPMHRVRLRALARAARSHCERPKIGMYFPIMG